MDSRRLDPKTNRRTSRSVWAVATASVLAVACQDGTAHETASQASVTHADAPVGLVEDSRVEHTDLEFRENVHWLDESWMEGSRVTPDSIAFGIPHAPELTNIRTGDVVITSAGSGFWRRVLDVRHEPEALVWTTRDARLDEVLKRGTFSYTSGNPELRTARSALAPTCTEEVCTGTVDLGGGLAEVLARDSGGLQLDVEAAAVDLIPAVQYQIGVDEDGTFERLQASGWVDFDLVWDTTITGAGSLREAFSVRSPGDEVATVEWSKGTGDSIRNVDPVEVVTGLQEASSIGARYQASSQTITVTIGGVTATYDDVTAFGGDPEDPTGGVVLDDFALWFDEEFEPAGAQASVFATDRGRSAVLAVTIGSDNFLAFSILGRSYTVTPYVTGRYDIGSPAGGRVRTGLQGSGYVIAGYDCHSARGCSALPHPGSPPPPGATSVSEVVDGEPWLNFRALLRLGVALSAGGSEIGSAEPVGLAFESQALVSKPYCPYNASARLSSTSVRSRRYSSLDTELFDLRDVSFTLDGCTLGDPDTRVCDTCQPDDVDCLREACGADNMNCVFGSCAEAGEYSVTLQWDQATPAVDLDLYIELPSDDIVSRTNPDGGAAKHVLESDGAACPDCRGRCEGDLRVACSDVTPTGPGECPGTCTFEPPFSICIGLSAVSCSSSSPPCPSGCSMSCTSTLIGSCECVGGTFVVDDCSGRSTSSSCGDNPDCAWYEAPEGTCEGGTMTCSDLDEGACSAEAACSWNQAAVESTDRPPFAEQVIFGRALAGQYRAWVVNSSGTEGTETVPYSLIFDVGDEPFRLRGELEPGTGAKSIEFDFER